MDGSRFSGRRIRVEPAGGGGGGGPRSRSPYGYRRSPPRRRSPRRYSSRGGRYRVIVEDIPDMASWQDLKDFARDNGAARPIEADVVTKGGEVVGIMEFGSQRDVDDAVSHLDKCKICPGRGARHNYPPTTVRVYDDSNRSKSRSKSRSRSRSRRRRRRSSRSPRRSRSRPRRRSRSDRRSRSRSGSRRSRSRRHSRSASRSRSPRKDSRSRSKNRDEENQMDTSGAGEAMNG